MIKKMFALALALWCNVTLAQEKFTITGVVTDTHNNPLPSAILTVENSTIGTYTNNSGEYSLSLTAGKHTIIVQFVGFDSLRCEISIHKNTKLNIQLHESPLELDAAGVYAKSKTQVLREGVYAVSAVNVKQSVNLTQSLSDMVNRSAGIKVRTEGGMGSDFDLSLNGMSGNSIRYFIDGVPLSSKGTGVNLSNIPTNIIDRIEIYKGVVPAYLGADALGGAVNIITKESRSNYLDASYSIGSFHSHKFDFNANYVGRKTGLIVKPTVGVNYSKNDYLMREVEVWDPDVRKYVITSRPRFHDDYLSIIGQVELGFKDRKWTDAFFITASVSKIDKDIQTGSVQNIVYGMAERKTKSLNIGARYRKNDFLTKGLKVSLTASHTADHSQTIDTAYRKYDWNGNYIPTSRNEITGRGRSIRHYSRPLTIIHGNADYELTDNHSFNLNYLLNRTGNNRYDEMDDEFEPSNDVLANNTIGLSYNQTFFNGKMNNSFFVKDYISYLKIEQTDLSWITGSDGPSSKTKSYYGYGIASRYAFRDEFAIKVSYEHSVRLPVARELLGNGVTVLANVRLQPEQSSNFNIGIFGEYTPSRKHLINYEANGFIRNASDYIRAVLSEQDGLMKYANVSSVSIKGLEGEISYEYNGNFRAMLNCSWQDARDMTPFKDDGKPSITYKNKIPNRPWLFSNTELNAYFHNVFTKGDKISVGYLYQYVHWFYLTWASYGSLANKSVIPTQHQHNMMVTYSWKENRYNFTVECNNLFNSILYDNFMLQKPGRSIFCKFRIFLI